MLNFREPKVWIQCQPLKEDFCICYFKLFVWLYILNIKELKVLFSAFYEIFLMRDQNRMCSVGVSFMWWGYRKKWNVKVWLCRKLNRLRTINFFTNFFFVLNLIYISLLCLHILFSSKIVFIFVQFNLELRRYQKKL